MQRFQLRFPDGEDGQTKMDGVDVPDIVTALVVADILSGGGTVEIRDGAALVAKVEKQASSGAPFWKVSGTN